MNKRLIKAIVTSLSLGVSGVSLAESTPAEVSALQAEAKSVIQTLASSLGKELKTAAQRDGLPAAIEVCNTKAIPITDDVSGMKGWTIGRTSLKLRNPNNAPDAWERKVLEQFALQADQGADLTKLAYSEVITATNGQKSLRMMKAIPVAQQCLACHGSELNPAVNAKLNSLYPHDNATGFKVGDLRGAFSLEKKL